MPASNKSKGGVQELRKVATPMAKAPSPEQLAIEDAPGQATAASSKRKAVDDGTAPKAKKAGYNPGQLNSQCRNYFQRIATGKAKRADEAEVTQAKEAVDTFDNLGDDDKKSFAKAFFSNKGNKTFGFIKEYTEKVSAKKTVSEGFKENYYTRTLM